MITDNNYIELTFHALCNRAKWMIANEDWSFFQKIFKSRITYMYFYDIDDLGTWKWFLR